MLCGFMIVCFLRFCGSLGWTLSLSWWLQHHCYCNYCDINERWKQPYIIWLHIFPAKPWIIKDMDLQPLREFVSSWLEAYIQYGLLKECRLFGWNYIVVSVKYAAPNVSFEGVILPSCIAVHVPCRNTEFLADSLRLYTFCLPLSLACAGIYILNTNFCIWLKCKCT